MDLRHEECASYPQLMCLVDPVENCVPVSQLDGDFPQMTVLLCLGCSGACSEIFSRCSLFLLVFHWCVYTITSFLFNIILLFLFLFISPPSLTFCCPVLHGLSDWNGDWDAPKIWGFIQSEKLAAQQPCKLLFTSACPRLTLTLPDSLCCLSAALSTLVLACFRCKF